MIIKENIAAVRRFVGEFGGYAVIETDDVADIHKLTTTFAVFQFRLEPVLDVMDTVAAEAEAIA